MSRLGCGLVLALCLVNSRGIAQTLKAPYPGMLPIARYLMPREAEISLARSAAPRSISDKAQILVFTKSGYQKAVTGTNGRSFEEGLR